MGQLNLRVLIQAVDRATGPVRRVARALRVDLPNASRIGGRALRSLTGLATRAAQALGAIAGFSFGALSVGAIRTGAKFEQFGAVLETIEGSAAKAEASMAWVEEFAKTTPYELDQVMEAFVALRAYGIDPTDGTLRTLGDTASAMNKSLMQAVEMFADAQTGEFERLKEFGVRGSAAGAQVRLTYQQAGREVVKTSKKSGDAIRENLLGIFDSRFAGAMERQSRTAKGLWSNLMDWLTSFQRQIADAGLFDFVKAELAALLAQVNAAAANGQLAEWAAQISAAMVQMLVSVKALITGIDWVAFTTGIIDAANGFARFMDFIGGFEGLITGGVAGAIAWLTTSLMGLGITIATALGVATAPVAAVIGIIGLIGLAGWLLYRNWNSIWAALKRGWNGFVRFFRGLGVMMKAAFRVAIDALWQMLPPWLRTIFRGAAFVLRVVGRGLTGGPPNAPGARPQVGTGNPRAPNGQVAITVHQDGRPASVRVRGDGVALKAISGSRGGYGR